MNSFAEIYSIQNYMMQIVPAEGTGTSLCVVFVLATKLSSRLPDQALAAPGRGLARAYACSVSGRGVVW